MAIITAHNAVDITETMDLNFGNVSLTVANDTLIQGTIGNFTVNIFGNFTYDNGFNGTITDYNYMESGQIWFEIHGLSVNALRFIDDDGLVQYLFEGKDTFTGSPYDDIWNGYADDDVMTGNGGNDTLDGGSGSDTLILSGLPSQYTLNGNSLTGLEGLDIVSSIEQYKFGSFIGNPLCAANLTPDFLIDPDGAGPGDSPATDLLQSISDLYVAYFNRAADTTGLMYWFTQISKGSLTLATTAQSFTDSPEYKATYPEGLSNHDFINTIYLNLFDRAPDAGGWVYWENVLNQGSPRDLFIYTVIQGAYAPTGGASDRALLNNKHDVSLYYSEQLATHPSEGFDKKIDQVLNRVTADPHTVEQAESVIDYVIANPITLTGVISDTPTWDTFWA